MVNLEDALDHCLQQVVEGTLSVEECLARYPQHADALRQLLHAAEQLDIVSTPEPSPTFKARARRELLDHMHAHSRRSASRTESRQQTVALSVWGRVSDLLANAAGRLATQPAYVFVLLLIMALLGVTTAAQAALPTQPLYGWKRASENVWRSVHPDPVSADLALSERRTSELIRVAGDPQAEDAAHAAYGETLERLAAYDEADTRARIAAKVAEQQARLRAAGIDLSPLRELPPPAAPTSPDTTPIPTAVLPATATATSTGSSQVRPTATSRASATSQPSATPQPSQTPQPDATESILPTTLPQVTVELPSPLPETVPATTPDATPTLPPIIPTLEVTSLPLPTLSTRPLP